MRWQIVTQWQYSLKFEFEPLTNLSKLRDKSKSKLNDYLDDIENKILDKFGSNRNGLQPYWSKNDFKVECSSKTNEIFISLNFTNRKYLEAAKRITFRWEKQIITPKEERPIAIRDEFIYIKSVKQIELTFPGTQDRPKWMTMWEVKKAICNKIEYLEYIQPDNQKQVWIDSHGSYFTIILQLANDKAIDELLDISQLIIFDRKISMKVRERPYFFDRQDFYNWKYQQNNKNNYQYNNQDRSEYNNQHHNRYNNEYNNEYNNQYNSRNSSHSCDTFDTHNNSNDNKYENKTKYSNKYFHSNSNENNTNEDAYSNENAYSVDTFSSKNDKNNSYSNSKDNSYNNNNNNDKKYSWHYERKGGFTPTKYHNNKKNKKHKLSYNKSTKEIYDRWEKERNNEYYYDDNKFLISKKDKLRLNRDYYQWSQNEVVQWLKYAKLDSYINTFERKRIKGSKLYEMDEEYVIKELRLKKKDAKILEDEIMRLTERQRDVDYCLYY